MLPSPRATFEARMLAAADRLFADFDELPVRTIFVAIRDARSRLRDKDTVALPDDVERLARQELAQLAATA